MRAFRALAIKSICTVGAMNLGTHSLLRGAAMALFHAGVPLLLVTQALWHASARSDESYLC